MIRYLNLIKPLGRISWSNFLGSKSISESNNGFIDDITSERMKIIGYFNKAIHKVRRHFKPEVTEEKMLNRSYFREISRDRVEEFVSKGYKKRHFFPHRIYYAPKCGPDGFKLTQRMCGIHDPNKLWEVVLFATSPVIDEFPEELFFDNDIVWHQQQLGKIGHISTSNLALDGNNLYCMVHISDLVQRISRRREYKTKIENRFKGWPHMLFNSIMNFAIENDVKRVHSPTSVLALKHTDPERCVQEELFERVYDRTLNKQFLTTKKGRWWIIDVAKNRGKIVTPEQKWEQIENGKTICLCHDLERGYGHMHMDPNFSLLAHKTSSKNLENMLSIERDVNVKTTYNVLGCFLNEVRGKIEMDGHCIAFHSYDHNTHGDQLEKCRQIDYRIKGYRPPQSKITRELRDKNLCFHNFEWLASSAYSFGMNLPKMENRIVKIPISFDDFDLHERKMSYEEWDRMAIDRIRHKEFIAFCLHDCYAHYWLPHYKGFLKKIKRLGKLRTLNEVAAEVILENCM